MTTWRRCAWAGALAAILASAVAVRIPYATEPFLRPHEDDNARYGLAARNHLRHGFSATRGGIYLAVGGPIPGAPPPAPGDFYTNHPATLTWILALVYELLGESPLATRLPSIAASLAGILLLHSATRRRFGHGVALVSAGFLALAPGSAWAGRLAVFLPYLLPLGLLALDRHARRPAPSSLDGEGTEGGWAVAACVAAATLVDWAGLLLVPALAVITPRGLARPVLAATAAASLNLVHIAWIRGVEGLSGILLHALGRAGLAGIAPSAGIPHASFSWWDLPRVVGGEHIPYLMTPIGMLLAAVGLVILGVDRSAPRRRRWVAGLVTWGGLYILVFPQAAVVHDYWIYYLLPAAGVLAGVAAVRLAAGPRTSPCRGHATREVARSKRIILVNSVRTAGTLLLLMAASDQGLRILERRYWNDAGWYDDAWKVVEFARQSGASPGDAVVTREPIRSFIAQHAADIRVIHDPEISHTMVLIRREADPRMSSGS